MREISAENLEIIGKGVTATVYALNDDLILKVFRDVVPEKEIEFEYSTANLVYSLGIVTPAAREIVKCNGETGIIYDRIHGVTLAEEMVNKKENYYGYGKRYGEIVLSMHSKSIPEARIAQAEALMESLFDNTYGLIGEAEKEKLIAYLKEVPSADCLLHGDISPVNIMVENARLIVIDVPTIMKGHPVFDLLQPYAFCKLTPDLYERYLTLSDKEKESDVGKFMARFGGRYLGKDATEEVWRGFLDGYFGGEKKVNFSDIECVLRFYNAIKLMGSVYMRGKFSPAVVEFLVNEGREQLKESEKQFEECKYSALKLENYL